MRSINEINAAIASFVERQKKYEARLIELETKIGKHKQDLKDAENEQIEIAESIDQDNALIALLKSVGDCLEGDLKAIVSDKEQELDRMQSDMIALHDSIEGEHNIKLVEDAYQQMFQKIIPLSEPENIPQAASG